MANDIELRKTVKKYARHIEFPIEVYEDNEKSSVIDVGYEPIIKNYFSWNNDYFAFLPTQIDDENVKGHVSLLGFNDDELEWIPITDNYMPKYFQRLTSHHISNEGIFVNNSRNLPIWLDDTYVVSDYNIHNNLLELNAARNEIIENEKNEELIVNIEKKY